MARDFLIGAATELGQSDLTLVQLGALMLLEDGTERTIKEVAEQLGRSISAASRLLDNLVKRRLVRRWEDPNDRRARRVALGERGKAVLAALLDRRAGAQLELMEWLEPDERATVARGMSLLAEAARRRKAKEEER